MTPFAFVAISGDSGKVSKADSAQVRKLCMIGKNKKKDSRRSKREAQRKATIRHASLLPSASSKSPEIEIQAAAPSPADEARVIAASPHSIRDVRVSMAAISGIFRYDKNWSVPPKLSWPEPMKVGGEVLSAASQHLLHRFSAFSRAKHAFFPIEKVVDFDSYKVDHSSWLANDDLFFHSALYSTEALTAFAAYRPMSTVARLHLQESLLVLSDRLSVSNEAISDATVFSVVNLIITASCIDQDASLRTHLQGIKKICNTTEILQRNPKLAFKLDNIDLRWTLLSGDEPMFLTKPQSWKPLFPALLPLGDDRLLLNYCVPELDLTVVEVYHDMQQVAHMVVNAYNEKQLLAMPTFQSYMHSCQSRLLHITCRPQDYLSEALRLSLLAFMTTCFSIGGRPLFYKDVTCRIISAIQRYKRRCRKKHVATEYRALMLWMLIVVKLANPGANHVWMQLEWDELLRASKLLTWASVRGSLMRVLWIPPLHDNPGQAAYESQALTRQSQ